MKILAVSGSLSGSSSNTALLQLLQQAAAKPAEVVLYGSLDDIPNFSPDRDHPTPPAVAAWRAAVSGADAVLIATPEYAGGMPGVLKNALDWLVGSGELYGKLAVVLSAAPSARTRRSRPRVCRPDVAHAGSAGVRLVHRRRGTPSGWRGVRTDNR